MRRAARRIGSGFMAALAAAAAAVLLSPPRPTGPQAAAGVLAIAFALFWLGDVRRAGEEEEDCDDVPETEQRRPRPRGRDVERARAGRVPRGGGGGSDAPAADEPAVVGDRFAPPAEPRDRPGGMTATEWRLFCRDRPEAAAGMMIADMRAQLPTDWPAAAARPPRGAAGTELRLSPLIGRRVEVDGGTAGVVLDVVMVCETIGAYSGEHAALIVEQAGSRRLQYVDSLGKVRIAAPEPVPSCALAAGNAVGILGAGLRADPAAARAWLDNISVAMQDEGCPKLNADRAAAAFLRRAFGVEVAAG